MGGISADLAITLAVLAGAMVLFLFSRVRPDVVALLVVVTLGVSGVLTPQETFSGFSRSAVITILAIFIMAEGLRRSGMTDKAGALLLRLGGHDERRLVMLVMFAGALLSLFMNNLAAAAVLLPAVAGAARTAGVKPSRLLLPLAFATMLGGMATLFTTTNIVTSGVLREAGYAGFGVLDFAPVGLPLLIAGALFIALWGRRLLPQTSAAEKLSVLRHDQVDLLGIYRLGERLFRARVPRGSPLDGCALAESGLRERFRLSLVWIERGSRKVLDPGAETVLEADDVLLVTGKAEDFRKDALQPWLLALPAREWRAEDFESKAVVVVEAALTPRSGLIGKTLSSSMFRLRYGLTVLAIWRAGAPIRTNLANVPLEFGDALLLQGPRQRTPLLHGDRDLIPLEAGAADVTVPAKGWITLAIMAVTLVLAAAHAATASEVMLGGALAMMLTGVLESDQAYAAIEWRSVFLVAGMLPLATAMSKTGATSMIAESVLRTLGGYGPVAVLGGFVLLSVLLSQVMHGAAVSAMIVPIAVQTARQLGVDPHGFAMGVALATSMAFLTPLGHPVNVLVMGPGGYRLRDYVRLGLPLTALLGVLLLLLVPIVWR